MNCQHCGTGVYNDSDSNPQDPAGPWADDVTTDYDCPESTDGLHHV